VRNVAKRIRIKNFGESGLRIAYREGTADERAIKPWMDWSLRSAAASSRN
jgi:hypothetical protein